MRPLLYLDTARLGQMTPAAKNAQLDFVRLSAEEPSSLYFERFLRDGFSAWPTFYQERYPALHTWSGVSGLKNSIRRLINSPASWQVLLANRSLSLVHVGSSCMFRVCRNVLATDLSWPTYAQTIEGKASLTGNRITTIPLRDEILSRGWTVNDVANHLANAFIDHRCDGLFLPAVDHLGIRLPIREIVEHIQDRSELRFCFIDAAQAFCHVPLHDSLEFADFIVAGSHKWMGAYLPTGIGLFGQRRSRDWISSQIAAGYQASERDDPLLAFTEQLARSQLHGYSETANLASLFSCAGAASDNLANTAADQFPSSPLDSIWQRIRPPCCEWTPKLSAGPMRSRISILEASDPFVRCLQPEEVRSIWQDAGATLTAYPGGRVRISLRQRVS